ncbi:uncharacterized protein LY89DRAFT_739445 [Mollisia scopiformis]|uniref:F-box domain-containing protein n=1 Tax=Mollisia scopiformis TaxID=149040 RepID=A0A194WTH4_MOLSC|nr:uncharacterized protein LY89DRAFT_739445 [Mollisia scopiformis]KUJ11250.1 hypothetical protein LY89DRAFT_739445 [Mollisia scopiformis]
MLPLYDTQRLQRFEQKFIVPTNKMLFIRLNDDVLRFIAASVAQSEEVADILGLAPTCRRLYNAARFFVPSCLRIEVPSRRFLLLKRTMNEDASYGLGVYSAKIEAHSSQREGTWDELREFFRYIPNLKQLSATDSCLNVISVLLSPELSFRQSLKKLALCDVSLTAVDFFELVRLPQLHHLEVREFMNYDDDRNFSDDFHPSQLQVLKLYAGQIRCRTLQRIVGSSPSLHTLDCRSPLYGPSQKNVIWGSAFIATELSPLLVLSTLLSASQTLVTLNLTTNSQEWQGHDGTRLDLVRFRALKHISASAKLFVAPLSLGITRGGLFRLLPPSLITLQLKFRFSIGILYATQSQRIDLAGYQRLLDQTLDPSVYEWILELAQHKRDFFPNLESVRMVELILERRLVHLFSSEDWVLPARFEQAFNEAGTTLKVSVRAPVGIEGRGYIP